MAMMYANPRRRYALTHRRRANPMPWEHRRRTVHHKRNPFGLPLEDAGFVVAGVAETAIVDGLVSGVAGQALSALGQFSTGVRATGSAWLTHLGTKKVSPSFARKAAPGYASYAVIAWVNTFFPGLLGITVGAPSIAGPVTSPFTSLFGGLFGGGAKAALPAGQSAAQMQSGTADTTLNGF